MTAAEARTLSDDNRPNRQVDLELLAYAHGVIREVAIKGRTSVKTAKLIKPWQDYELDNLIDHLKKNGYRVITEYCLESNGLQSETYLEW